jgi:hypothetical protein
MQVQIKLYRGADREPEDHFYGEPVDRILDELIGGREAWSSLREDRSLTPEATLRDATIRVELHEDGPLFQFLVEQIPHIPTYVSTLAAVVSAWAAMKPKKDNPWWKREIQVSVEKHFYSGSPSPQQVERITQFIAELAEEDQATKTKKE